MRLRHGWGGLVVAWLLTGSGCGADDPDVQLGATVQHVSGDDAGADDDGGAIVSEPPSVTPVTPAAAPQAQLLDREFGCKLLNRADDYDPTANQLQTRFNLRGADLGLSLVIDSELYLFFGDSLGYRTIWSVAEADSIAHIPLATVRNELTSLCRNLDFYVTSDARSVASGEDPSVQRDFAAAFIYSPPGQPVSDFVSAAPLGQPNIPGRLEVPSGVLRDRETTYVFYASGATELPYEHPTRSFLARWDDRSAPGYDVVTLLDDLTNGDLGGHFVHVSPVKVGEYTYLFGSGMMRRSAIYLARTRDVEALSQYELYDAADQRWVRANTLTQAQRIRLTPILEQTGVGELSAFYVAQNGLFGLLYQRELRNGSGDIVDNRVVARFAKSPEGLWTDAITVSDMGESDFRTLHCCGRTCEGDEIVHCDRAGLYAAYALPFITAADGVVKVPYLISTWDPYNVVMFEASFSIE